MMTVKEAKRRWSTRRRQYAVGYIASGNLIFMDALKGAIDGEAGHPMSLPKAKALLASMPCKGAAIFKLVPIAIGGGKKR